MFGMKNNYIKIGSYLFIALLALTASSWFIYKIIKGSYIASDRQVLLTCEANLRDLEQALCLYSSDNKDFYPDLDGAEGLRKLYDGKYIKDMRLFICPFSNLGLPANGVLHEENLSYVYKGGFSVKDEPIIFLMDKKNNHKDGSINVLFSDFNINNFSGKEALMTHVKKNYPDMKNLDILKLNK